jgi:Transketolase, C-terminal subunit
MKRIFINKLIERAKIDSNIWLIISDVGFGLVESFEKLFPDRFINVGIAEQNALGIAAGLAETGKNVYFYGISPFVTFRCLDQIRMFMQYRQLPIKIIGNGIDKMYSTAGYSHWAIEDSSVMQCFQNIETVTPFDEKELNKALNQSFENDHPMYIRLGRI